MEKPIEQFEYKVEGDEQKEIPEEIPQPKQEKAPLSSEDLEQYKKEGQEMVDSYKNLFTTFAKDVSLKFKMGDAFYIDLEHGEVNLDTKWFANKDFSKDQILWANLHELAHFRDLADDPEATMKKFEDLKAEAKRTASVLLRKYEETLGQSNPDLLKRMKEVEGRVSPKRMTPLQQAAYKMHHTFSNVLDDIYVNNLVSRKAPKYEEAKQGGQEIKRLYKEKLFQASDYAKFPRHLQFTYALLREEMIKDEQVVLSDEVKEVFDRKVKFQGKEYSVREIVDTFLKPRSGRDTKPSRRQFIVKNTLEPIFKELLNKDIEEWEPKQREEGENLQPVEGQQGEPEFDPNPFSQDYDQFDESNPDQIGEDEIKKWLDAFKEKQDEKQKEEARKKEEEAKTPEEKAQAAQEAMDRKWASDHGVNYETLKRYKSIEKEVEPYLTDLSELWRHIVMGSTPIVERSKEGYYKTGELDIPKVIKEWPQIERRELDEVKVMKRIVRKETLVQKPEKIRVRLVGDVSGSMAGEKMHVLQQCFVLILSSLREFNTYLNMNRERTKSKLEVDTEAWTFGEKATKVKGFRNERGFDDEQVESVKMFDQLDAREGSTDDFKALNEILSSLTASEREKIANEKIMEIVFEITDGGSTRPGEAKNAVDILNNIGVIIKGFQIGETQPQEKEVFELVWNSGQDKLGEVVGSKIDNLIPAITAALKKHLGNVRL